MKKWIIFWGVCCLGFAFVDTVPIEAKTEKMDYIIQWQGLSCTGTYFGELKKGCPNGEGKFKGNFLIAGEEKEEITYEGEWKDGKMHGKGILHDGLNKKIFSGKFKENKMDGKVREYTPGKEKEYSIKNYWMDMPYGICWQYEEDKKVGYDYFFHGMSVNQICREAEIFDYQDLLYYTEDYKYKKMKLEGTVVGGYREDDNRYLKVRDKNRNYYMVFYDQSYKMVATNYMPIAQKGKKMVVYGYFVGKQTYKGDVAEYPCMNAICTKQTVRHRFKEKNCQYNDFMDYPYIYQGQTVKIKGIFKGIVSSDDKWLQILIESDSYSTGKKKAYLGRVKNSKNHLKKLPKQEEEITVQGKMMLLSKYSEGKNSIYCPRIRISKIAVKK